MTRTTPELADPLQTFIPLLEWHESSTSLDLGSTRFVYSSIGLKSAALKFQSRDSAFSHREPSSSPMDLGSTRFVYSSIGLKVRGSKVPKSRLCLQPSQTKLDSDGFRKHQVRV
ncbi:hypothetical protein AVEN_110007-1 [Araneus ventricosus]|uniref:Uncharacterized protein n=1 Tax=Araneus ventricosus TaxID=182803 RepID=A0A4Y2JA19_ARAVE|nr:hypothetical protein AVEN_110007-1 [Araneus ventricosus]